MKNVAKKKILQCKLKIIGKNLNAYYFYYNWKKKSQLIITRLMKVRVMSLNLLLKKRNKCLNFHLYKILVHWYIDPIIKSCTSVLNIQKSQLKN